VEPPRITPPVPVYCTASVLPVFVSVLVKLTAPVIAFALLSVIVASSALVVKLAVPPTFNAPVCVMFPVVATTASVPLSVEPPRITPPVPVYCTASVLPVFVSVLVKLTAPPIAFALLSVIVASSALVVKLAVPPTFNAPVCVMFPVVATTASVPLSVEPPRITPPVPVYCTASVLPVFVSVLVKLTAPPIAFALLSVIVASSALVVKLAVPPTFNAPVCVMFPVVATTASVPLSVEPPRITPPVPVYCTASVLPVFVSVLVKLTAPPIAFALLSVIVASSALVVKLAVPPTFNAPVCVMFPVVATTASVPLSVEPPRITPPVPVYCTASVLPVFVSVLVKLTAPVIAFALLSVIVASSALVVKLAVPPTFNAPVCVMFPVVATTASVP